MIDPTEADIGRRVVYRAQGQPGERGVITSFNKHWVFVRYARQRHPDANGIATHRDDLHWADLAKRR